MSKKKIHAKRVVVTDFANLKKSMFEGFSEEPFAKMQGEALLISKNGTLYINKKDESADVLKKVWEILLTENIFTLAGFRRMILEKFPDAKIETVHEMKITEEEKIQVFAALLIPMELKRRATEKAYFGF